MDIRNVKKIYFAIRIKLFRFVTFSCDFVSKSCHFVSSIIDDAIDVSLAGSLFRVYFGITNEPQHEFIFGRATVADSHLALAGSIQPRKRSILELVDIGESWKATSASKFGASHQTVVRHSRRNNDFIGISGAYFSISIIEDLKV